LCSRAYQKDFTPFLEAFTDATHVLGRVDGLLVTHACWVTRWLQCATLPPLRTAYVEAVATDKGYRNQGLATMVMKRISGEIRQFDLGALSPAEPLLYARLGWQMWRGPLFIRTGEGLRATPNGEVMVLFLPNTPPLDLDAPLSAEWRVGELW
jgi:aminoglycoside 2'-N-acetyltransferase I